MNNRLYSALAIGLTLSTSAVDPAAAAGTLDEYVWRNRLVLAFTPAPSNTMAAAQRAERASAAAEWRDRQLVLIEIGADYVRVEGQAVKDADPDVLRQRFGVASGQFRAVLVGKDGGAKMTLESAIPNAVLFETIDAMPMRQNEMRRN